MYQFKYPFNLTTQKSGLISGQISCQISRVICISSNILNLTTQKSGQISCQIYLVVVYASVKYPFNLTTQMSGQISLVVCIS